MLPVAFPPQIAIWPAVHTLVGCRTLKSKSFESVHKPHAPTLKVEVIESAIAFACTKAPSSPKRGIPFSAVATCCYSQHNLAILVL